MGINLAARLSIAIAIGLLASGVWFFTKDDIRMFNTAIPCLESEAKGFCEDKGLKFNKVNKANLVWSVGDFSCLMSGEKPYMLNSLRKNLKSAGQ